MLFRQSTMADVLTKDMPQNVSRTGYYFSRFQSRTGYHFKAFLGQEQGQAFGIPAALPHPKIWGVPPPPPGKTSRQGGWSNTGKVNSRTLINCKLVTWLVSVHFQHTTAALVNDSKETKSLQYYIFTIQNYSKTESH